MSSPLGFVSEKQMTLKELDQIQQLCKNHSANHCTLNPEAITTSLTVEPSKHILHLSSKILDHLCYRKV